MDAPERRPYSDKLRDPRWQKKRLEILNRDGWRCLVCGSTTNTLHVHHAAYDGEPWEVSDALLYTVCAECHGPEHDAHREAVTNIVLILGRLGIRSSVDIWQLAESTSQTAFGLAGGVGVVYAGHANIRACRYALSIRSQAISK